MDGIVMITDHRLVLSAEPVLTLGATHATPPAVNQSRSGPAGGVQLWLSPTESGSTPVCLASSASTSDDIVDCAGWARIFDTALR